MSAPVLMTPGVYTLEVDTSQYIKVLSNSLLGIVTTAPKGVVNDNVLCASVSDIVNNFGTPDENHAGLVVARNFLANGGASAQIIRVTDTTDVAAAASITLIADGPYTLTAGTTGSFYGSSDDVSGMSAVFSNGQQAPETSTGSQTLTASEPTTITLSDVPIAPGTVVVTWNSLQIAVDDGAGHLVFNSGALTGATGTVDYNTGAVVITPPSGFTTATHTLLITANYWSTFNLQLVYTVINNGITISKEVLESYVGLTLGNFVAVLANSSNLSPPEDAPSNWPQAGSYAFTDGTDGTDEISDADFIGNTLGSSPTGLQILANPNELDINLVAIPGRSSSAITEALIQLASVQRADSVCLLDPPVDLTVSTVEDWANASGSYDDNEVIDSTYAAIYFPWYSSNNSITNGVDLVPPSAAAVQAFARSNYWQAPAGPNRGLLADFAGISISLQPGDCQSLAQNRINPITNLAGLGVMILGQMTATLESTSLDRVGARMTLLQLEKVISTAMYSFLFEPNDSQTWSQVVNTVQPILTSLTNTGRLYAGQIFCDSTTNTTVNINNDIMAAVIVVELPKYAEIIVIAFQAVAEGVTITESIITPAINAIP